MELTITNLRSHAKMAIVTSIPSVCIDESEALHRNYSLVDHRRGNFNVQLAVIAPNEFVSLAFRLLIYD